MRVDLVARSGLVESGRVGSAPAATFELEQAAEAFDLVGTGHAGGKVVLRPRH